MAQIFPIDFEEKLTMAQDDYILFSDSEDGNKIKKAQYKNLKGEPGTPGQDGEDGAAATITVGSTTTGAAGTSASVTNSGTSSAAILDFTIPQGAKGEPGEDGKDGTDGKDGVDGTSATITVGTTTTLPAGSSATVTNSGTASAAVLNFGIPKGDTGVGSGDVNGPASSTDGDVAIFDGNTGKLIKDGSVALSTLSSAASLASTAIQPGDDISDLNNDSGFITGITSTDVTTALGYTPYNSTNPDGYTTNTGDVVVSTDTGNELSTGVGLWFGTETDFSSISTPDTNTLYIQYKSDGGGGWTPGVNTVLYVPMSADLIDHGPNQFTLTNNGVILASNQANIDVGYFNGSAYLSGIYSNLFNFGDFHFGLWLKMGQISHDQFFLAGTSNGDMFIGYGNSNKFGVGRNGVAWDNSYNQSLTTGTWYYVSFDRSGTSFSVSVNTSTIGTGTNSQTYVTSGGYQIGNDGTGNYINGYMSDIILEDKARTAQEVSDYFNLTKGDYGIS